LLIARRWIREKERKERKVGKIKKKGKEIDLPRLL
jgi:hypothetical protein